MNEERCVALQESLGDLKAGHKKIFLVLKTTSSPEHDDLYFHNNFMQKVDELRNKIQPLFDECVDRVYWDDDEKGHRIGFISIQKSSAWKIAVKERELLEKLGLDRDHWWALVPVDHV
jgi:hypothetical protein